MIIKYQIFKTSIILMVFSVNFNPVYSAPTIPTSDNEVLLILEKSSLRSNVEKIKLQLHRNKNSTTALIKILQNTIERGKLNTEPRYIGLVSSYVDSYLQTQPTNVEFKILKATLLQHDHQFDAAITLLNNVISDTPTATNARLLRASVLQVQAKYHAAQQDCYSLLGVTSHLVTLACIAQINGLTKNTLQNYNTLYTIIKQSSQNPLAELSWSYDILAQLALQLGKTNLAQQHLLDGLKLAPNNIPLLNRYADLLISQKKFNKVFKLLENKNNDFTVLLRLAIAEKNSSSNTNYKQQFLNRLHKMLATRDVTHQREIAAFYLFVTQDKSKALISAKQNWMVQKELYDAQLLVLCAISNKDKNSAKPVLDWYKHNAITDIRLTNSINTLLTTALQS